MLNDSLSTPSTDPGYRARISNWLVPLALLVVAGLALSIDVEVARIFKENLLPVQLLRRLREVLENCEAYGHGVGATLIVMAIVVVDPTKIRWLPWLLSSSLGSGLVANLVKLALPRARPRDFDFTEGTVWDTFARRISESGTFQSFPSSHTATAVGFSVVLSQIFPRGRVFFMVLAALVGLQRIVSSAHYPSDVLAGAAVGWIVGSVSIVLSQSFATDVGESDPQVTSN